MREITSKEIAKIIKEYLTTGIDISEIVLDRYGGVSESEAKEITKDIKTKFDKAVDFCKATYGRIQVDKVIEILELPRDMVQTSTLDSEGHIVPGKIVEGDISFDPSHKTDIEEPKQGTSDFQFGDDSTEEKSIGKIPKSFSIEIPTAISSDPSILDINIPSFSEIEPEGIKIVKPGDEDPSFSFPKTDKINPGEKDDIKRSSVDESSIPTPSFDENDSYDVLMSLGKKKEDSEVTIPKSNDQVYKESDKNDLIVLMSNGNAQAVDALFKILNTKNGEGDIVKLDIRDIRGEKLTKLFNECCGGNCDKLHRTIQLFGWGVFSEAEIHKNLELPVSIPFIDDTIVLDGIPAYGEDLESTNDKWGEYCRKNREIFIKKLFAATYQGGGFGGK